MNGNPMGALVQAWREDSEYRARMEADPKAALAEKGVVLTDAAEARIAVNTPDTVHVVFPPPPNRALSDVALEGISGGQIYEIYDGNGNLVGWGSHGSGIF